MNRDSALKKIKDKRFHELCAGIVADMKRLDVPGVSVAVWHGDNQWSAGFGVTSVDNPLPVTADTLFQIGSISKTMTATVVMQLVEAGMLDLDAPVKRYLPSFKMADASVTEQVTTRHLLTHTGGWMGDYFNHYGHGNDALDKMVKSLVRLPQISPLGSVWSYNNAGFNIAARLIEVLTKQTYEEAVTQRLFRPAGMPETFFFPDDALMIRRFAVGHVTWDGTARVAGPWAIGRAANGVGGAICSTETLLQYARFHCGDGAGVMRAQTLQAMRALQVSAGGRGDMGLTWFIRDHGAGLVSFGHGGATKGQKALFRFVPDQQFAIAILTNSDLGSVVHDAAWTRALELYLGCRATTPATQKRDAAALAPYVGTYDYALWRFAVVADGDGFILKETPKAGFPTPSTPAGPPVADVRARFIGTDTFVCLDEPRKGEVGDFIRAADGSVAFLRIGGRANPRLTVEQS